MVSESRREPLPRFEDVVPHCCPMPTEAQAFRFWLRLGIISFGGPAGQIAIWGLAGATIATFCTFVPSFVFIIGGAPLIDRIRTTGAFSAALNGLTVAVVGVIGALAVFVARHAAFSDGDPDWLVIAAAAIAFVAIVRYKVGVVAVVASCAVIGLVASTWA